MASSGYTQLLREKQLYGMSENETYWNKDLNELLFNNYFIRF